jgi:hypothetical protein
VELGNQILRDGDTHSERETAIKEGHGFCGLAERGGRERERGFGGRAGTRRESEGSEGERRLGGRTW